MQQIKRNIDLSGKYMEAEKYDNNLKAISRNTWWHESKSKYDKVNELKMMNKMCKLFVNIDMLRKLIMLIRN